MTRPIAFSLPGIDARRQDHGVVRADLHVAVVVDRDPRQRRHRLALRAGAEAQDVLRRVARHVGVADLHAGGNAQVAEALRDLRVLDHPAADERHLAVELRRQIDEDLHPVDARGEGRDDQPPARAGEDLLERLDHFGFRAGEAAAVDVGAVGEERQHPLGAELREAVDVEMLAVDRRLIDLEVAGVDDDAERRMNGQRHAVGHAVRDADEFDRERTDVTRSRGRTGTSSGVAKAVLAQLGLDQREGQRRAVDRAVDERRHVRHAADVILVPVRQHQRARAAFLLEIGEVRDDAVHAEQLGVREHHAGIHDDGRLTPGERQHVHSELAEAAERHDFEHVCAWRQKPPAPVMSRAGPDRCRRAARTRLSGNWACLKSTRRDGRF